MNELQYYLESGLLATSQQRQRTNSIMCFDDDVLSNSFVYCYILHYYNRICFCFVNWIEIYEFSNNMNKKRLHNEQPSKFLYLDILDYCF
jgi:hypothetical protein